MTINQIIDMETNEQGEYIAANKPVAKRIYDVILAISNELTEPNNIKRFVIGQNLIYAADLLPMPLTGWITGLQWLGFDYKIEVGIALGAMAVDTYMLCYLVVKNRRNLR